MWHLRTKQGTFWVIESPETQKYVLGVDNDELGLYDNAEAAALDVLNQNTGFFPWDCQAHIRAPQHVTSWAEGEPESWSEG